MARTAGEKLDTAPVNRLRGERGNRHGAPSHWPARLVTGRIAVI